MFFERIHENLHHFIYTSIPLGVPLRIFMVGTAGIQSSILVKDLQWTGELSYLDS
jgi:hypothetical protein